MKINKKKRKFIYLISPDKIDNIHLFGIELEKILRLRKVSFFQLRLKNYKEKEIISMGRKIKKICKKYKTKFIVNDKPFIANILLACLGFVNA